MLDRAIQLKTPLIQTVHEELALAKDALSPTDWRTLSNICAFLQGFYDTIKATEGRRVILDKVLPSLDFMAIKFENAITTYEAQNDQFMISSLHTGWTKILKY